jgi:hypothetical protein
MSTEHEIPAGTLDNVPSFWICQKFKRSTEYDSIPKVPHHVSHNTHCEVFIETEKNISNKLWLPNFFHGKFPLLSSNRITASILSGKYQQPRCILATDILHLQHEQHRCWVFTLNVFLFGILSKTGTCWQFLVTVHLIKFQDNLSSWSHVFHMHKHITGSYYLPFTTADMPKSSV